MGLSVFFIVIIFCVWLSYENQKSKNQADEVSKSFWERERQANETRKQSTDQLHYITISEKTLPFIEINDKILDDCLDKLKNMSEKKIANLEGLTNTDLKLAYGVANLTYLQGVEENYFTMCKTLSEYAGRLSELNYRDESIKVLEFVIETGTTSCIIYKQLADLYLSIQSKQGMDYLYYKAEQLQGISKSLILHTLDKYQP